MSKKQPQKSEPKQEAKPKEPVFPTFEDFFTKFLEKRKAYFVTKLEQIDKLEKLDQSKLQPDQIQKINNKTETLEKIKYFDDIKSLYFESSAKKKDGNSGDQSDSKPTQSKEGLVSDIINLLSVGQAVHNFEKNQKSFEHYFNSEQMITVQELHSSVNSLKNQRNIENSKNMLVSCIANEALLNSAKQFLESAKYEQLEKQTAHQNEVKETTKDNRQVQKENREHHDHKHHDHNHHDHKHHDHKHHDHNHHDHKHHDHHEPQKEQKKKLFHEESEEEDQAEEDEVNETEERQENTQTEGMPLDFLKPLPVDDKKNEDEFRVHKKNNRPYRNRPHQEDNGERNYRNDRGDRRRNNEDDARDQPTTSRPQNDANGLKSDQARNDRPPRRNYNQDRDGGRIQSERGPYKPRLYDNNEERGNRGEFRNRNEERGDRNEDRGNRNEFRGKNDNRNYKPRRYEDGGNVQYQKKAE